MSDPVPDVIRVLEEFRRALDLHDESTMQQMAARWVSIEARLKNDIDLLAREMVDRRAAGREITQQMVWRMERYQQIKDQMQREILRYSEYASRTVRQAQQDLSALGIQAAQEAIQYSGVVGIVFNRLNRNALEAMAGYTADGTPLNTLLKESYPDALSGLVDALTNGIARGMNPAQIAQEMIDGAGMGFRRAVTIARTESARAYRAGSDTQYRKSGVVIGTKRVVKQSTACMACLMKDGEFIPLGKMLSDHPQGKCAAAPVIDGTEGPKWTMGQQYFLGLDEEQQRARMGSQRYELWQAGAFDLGDLARTSHSETWGDEPRVATLAELGG